MIPAIKKPKGLKKIHPDLPWKYPMTIRNGDGQLVTIEVYNCNLAVGGDLDLYGRYMAWIDTLEARED